MQTAIVIPWRSTGPDREKALKTTKEALTRYLPDAPIFLADDGSQTFSRSGSRNKGVQEAKAAGARIVVVCDADTIPERAPLVEAVRRCVDGRLHLPYTKCRLLNERGTIRQEVTHSVGGIWVMTIEAWESIGGQCEAFEGWGYEDDAFYLAASTLLPGPPVRHEGVIKCLWHEEEWVWGSEPYLANRRLYHQMKALSRHPERLSRFLKGEDADTLPRDKQLKIAALVHFSVPKKNAGAEIMLHEMLVALRARGHHVRVYVTENPSPNYDEPHELDGIEIFEAKTLDAVNLIKEWGPDVWTSHLKSIDYTYRAAKATNTPWAMIAHSDKPYTMRHLSLRPNLVTANTRWLVRENSKVYDKLNHIVVHPPVRAEKHHTNKGDCITLVNVSKLKGSEMFYKLVNAFPDAKFLAVEGAYENQDLRDLKNVEIVKHTSDMPGDVWSRTKILLMPSEYESYGMAGVEALASGIPVIASATTGLVEALSYSGIFVDKDDTDGWVEALRALLEDEEAYESASYLASKRSKEINPDKELRNWVNAVEKLVE